MKPNRENDSQFLFRIPKPLKAAAKRVARRHHQSLTGWLLNLIEQGVNSVPLRPTVKPRRAKGACTRCRCGKGNMVLPQCLCYCHEEI